MVFVEVIMVGPILSSSAFVFPLCLSVISFISLSLSLSTYKLQEVKYHEIQEKYHGCLSQTKKRTAYWHACFGHGRDKYDDDDGPIYKKWKLQIK